MDKLQILFAETPSFEETCKIMRRKDVIELSKSVLTDLQLGELRPQQLLSAFLVCKYPQDVLGPQHMDTNKDFLELATLLTNPDNETNLPNIVRQFMMKFNEWKKGDYTLLSTDLFNKYHSLGMDIMNASDEEKPVLEECRVAIMKEAEKIGGSVLVNEIKSYLPVVIDMEALAQQYSNAFWDTLKEDFDKGVFGKIYIVLEHLTNIFTVLYPRKRDYFQEVIDVAFIKQQVDNKVYSVEQQNKLANVILDIIKTLQSPAHDAHLDEFRKDLQENGVYLPTFLKEVAKLSQTIVDEIEELKRNLK